MINPDQLAEDKYDRLDAQGQLNAAEMREASGFQAADAAEFTVQAMFARHPEWAFREVTPAETQATATTDPLPAPHPTDKMHYGLNKAGWTKHADTERLPELRAEVRAFGNRPPKTS